MSDISKFTGRFRINLTNQNESARKVAKKPRQTLACHQCRASKLRCDKGRPCATCVKRDGGSSCLYAKAIEVDDEEPAATNGSTAAGDRLDRLELMVTQLIQSRDAALRMVPKPDTPPDIMVSQATTDSETPESIACALKYPTVLEEIMDNIMELKLTIPSLSNELEEMPATEYNMQGSERIFASSSNLTLDQIISQYLPARDEADDLVSIYLYGELIIQPYFHIPQFKQQYEEFWEEPTKMSPMWISILFSIFTLTAMARETSSSPSISSDAKVAKAEYHAAAGECLAVGQYYRPQPYAPQALSLYAHCVNMKNLEPSREAGAILSMGVRLAYQMGYHRDPDVFGTFSVFEGEMRRRFWAGCKQVDMMTAFQLGLPSNILLDNCDTRSPRNLLDSDFGPDSKELPPSRSESEATPILWFIVKDRLVLSFSKVCQDALSLRQKSDEEVMALDEEVRRAHDTIPPLLRVRPIADCAQDSRFTVMARFYLELLSLKGLCILHRKRMTSGNTTSTMKCVEAGLAIVRLVVGVYKEFGPGGALYQARFMFNNYYMTDFLLGVIVLCLYVNMHRDKDTPAGLPLIGTSSEILSLLERAHGICVDKSSMSRDARKVSMAIQLALRGQKTTRPSARHNGPQESQPAADVLDSPRETDDTWLDSLYPTNSTPGPNLSFGALDPFNFMDVEPYNFGNAILDADVLDFDANAAFNYPP